MTPLEQPISHLLQLTKSLLNEASVTPFPANCLELIQHTLSSQKHLSFRRMDHQGVANLFIYTKGTRNFPLLFSGHIDVVPPGPLEQWQHPPFQATISQNCLYGRGSVDMKSSVSAFVMATLEYLRCNGNQALPIAIMLTSDEEGPAQHGTKHMIETLVDEGYSFQYALVGEPTSVEKLGDTIKIGRRGSLTGKLTVQGEQMHVAYSHDRLNPLSVICAFLAEAAQTSWEQQPAEHFPATKFTPTQIHSDSGASNTTAKVASCQFNFRYNPAVSAEILQQKVHTLLQKHQLRYSIAWEHGSSPFYKPPGKFVLSIQHIIQRTLHLKSSLSTSGGTSDARFLAAHCTEIVELGPLCTLAHHIDENIPLTDLENLYHLYLNILQNIQLLPTPIFTKNKQASLLTDKIFAKTAIKT
jgi:succinyl-diaminopimelate desuccinylase